MSPVGELTPGGRGQFIGVVARVALPGRTGTRSRYGPYPIRSVALDNSRRLSASSSPGRLVRDRRPRPGRVFGGDGLPGQQSQRKVRHIFGIHVGGGKNSLTVRAGTLDVERVAEPPADASASRTCEYERPSLSTTAASASPR